MLKVFDNVIPQNRLEELYDELICTQMWSINRQSSSEYKYFHNFPGHMIFERKEGITSKILYEYFSGLIEHLRHRHKEEYGQLLPPKLNRIHLGAKTLSSHTSLHTDTDQKGVVIVGFLTPKWKVEWGGDLRVEDKLIKYKPGRFSIFDTDKRHDGYAPKGDCPLWRITVNIVLLNE